MTDKPLSRDDRPESIRAQIEMLGVGESYACGFRAPLDSPRSLAAAREELDALARNMSVQVSRVKGLNPKREYVVERALTLAMKNDAFLCTVLVTRLT